MGWHAPDERAVVVPDPGRDGRLLIVDDDPSNTELLRAVLARAGFVDVHAVDDPRRALSEVARLRPDLVVLDWHMPDVSGEDVLTALRADGRWHDLPVVVLTADLDARRRSLAVGGTDFMTKPIDPVEVDLRIRNVLRLRGLHERLRGDNRQLERAVAHRTEELEAANRELRRLAVVRRDFTSMASHEMRTPLTVVLGFLEHWSRAGAASIEPRHLDAAQRNARRLQHLINNLLLASRVERDDEGRRHDPCSVGELLQAGVEASGIDVAVSIDAPSDLDLDGDAELLTQLVANLLSNAARYGEPPVVASAEASTATVVVTISDAGPGVPEAFRPHLFQRYSQATTGDRRTARGAGLGLWISHRIAELHGGELRYAPRSGGGSSFTFVVPRSGPATLTRRGAGGTSGPRGS